MRLLLALALVAGSALRVHAEDKPAHDFIADAKALLVVGACAEGEPPPNIKPQTYAAHCKALKGSQDQYKKNWLAKARTFFDANVPKSVPKIVVYPFAGGDLATALAVYPDADEITTLSLEPAGDPRALGKLTEKEIKQSLQTVAKELGSLYRSNFSVTMNMIGAMRGGHLPTQLIFSLSALSTHGYEPISLRYFRLTPEGDIHYLTDDDLAAIDAIKDTGKRNAELSSIELKFKKIGGTKEQTYRHILANLDDTHLKADPSALLHLEKKGNVAAMTKAASYLLTFENFVTMRKYIIEHVQWMVSDSTGLPPKYGTPAGFEYETHGAFEKSNMKAGESVAPVYRAMFKAQPKRELPFRFGYPDGKFRGHLVIMRKKQ